MAKFNGVINTFTAGEISPRFFGQTNLEGYSNSCEEVLNKIVLPQGGAMRRAGTRIVTSDIGSGDQVPDTSFFSSATYARPLTWILADGTRRVLILRPGNPTVWRVYNEATASFIPVLGSPDINFTWTEAQLREAQYAQTGDYLVLTHPTKPPTWIYPFGAFNFQAAAWWQAFPGLPTTSERYPFNEPNINNNFGLGSITPTATTGTITVNSSTGFFGLHLIGTILKLSNVTSSGHLVLTAFISPTQMTGVVLSTLPGLLAFGTAAGTTWEQSAWNSQDGFPSAVAFFESRVYYGGTTRFPNRFWASRIGDFDNLMPIPFVQDPAFLTYTTSNDRPWFADISPGDINGIQWFSPGKTLAIGTKGRENTLGGSGGAAGPLNPTLRAATSYGSAYVQPVRISNKVFFCQRSGERIRDIVFSFQEDDYKSSDLTIVAEHLFRTDRNNISSTDGQPYIQQMVVTQSPFPIVWVIDNQGDLYSANIDKDINVLAWSRHALGGSGTGSKRPRVLGISGTIFNDVSNTRLKNAFDDLFLTVRRIINGVPVISFEVLGGPYSGDENDLADLRNNISEEPIFCDYARRSKLFAASTTHSGFGHLVNETVQVVADGKYIGDYVVPVGGTLVLPKPYFTVIAGLKYVSRIVTVPLEMGSRFSTAQGSHKKPHEAFIRFYRTLGAKFGKKGQTNLEEIPMRDPTTPMNEVTPLYSGEKRVVLNGGYEFFYQFQVEQENPLPCEITSIVFSGVTYD